MNRSRKQDQQIPGIHHVTVQIQEQGDTLNSVQHPSQTIAGKSYNG